MARSSFLSILLLALLPAGVVRAETAAHDHGVPVAPQAGRSPHQSNETDVGGAWRQDEIDLARARCNSLLSGLKVVMSPVNPLREGECGTPAPVEVLSIGSNPQVTLSTPVVMTCDMVAGLHKWLKNDVQPAAREILGSPVVRLEIMSSYSCRNAYGRKKTRLSEHGRANAVDVGAFLTQKGESVDVLTYWGHTERELRAQIAASAAAAKVQAAKAEAIKREAERVQAALEAEKTKERQAGRRDMAAPGLRGSIGETATSSSGASPTVMTLTPQHLGGPKVKAATAASTDADRKQSFLRRVHAAACRTFGTILGPEANSAHRNHFHLDMAERKQGNYCE